ncbi:ABC transporter ATP-binding protein [Prosthecomicrobium hirschii]|uniref:ABC transporter ATP-binding protein n=1 Tax=Prosthecodimorpha hirschii TaxID=665126 RepID=UPI00112998E7|nr:ABC transporter ATP-binding protein [Prosthecomicrobium hirschii]TPQ52558.1 ABC transporter ATP-binding protein [Prosthecomicrobium hirschii]
MLEVEDLAVSYGAVRAVRGVSLRAEPGRITAILGANGSGKSSLIRAVMGLVAASGTVRLDGVDVSALSAERRAHLGLGCVLEGRRLFRGLTVEENLEVAWRFGRRHAGFAAMRAAVFDRFPALAEKRSVAAGLLSGGQQQMLIVSSATIRSPRWLMLDEPSLGLAPVIVQQLFDFVVDLARSRETTVLLTEQMASMALRIADYGWVLRQGALAVAGDRALLASPEGSRRLAEAYL